MRLAVVNITNGGISGGYREYLRNMIPRLARHPDIEAIKCIAPSAWGIGGWFDGIAGVECVGMSVRELTLGPFRSRLRGELRGFRPDVIYVPVERSFRYGTTPVVHMLQNMEPYVGGIRGNPLRLRCRQRVQYLSARRALKNASRVIAVSEFVRGFLCKEWGIPELKVGLVYHGITIPSESGGRRPAQVNDAWAGHFLFLAGSIRPARGIEDALMAMKCLSHDNIEAGRLVIAGETDSSMVSYRRRLEVWIEQNGLSERVCWTGKLAREEMAWCFDNCRLFLMTSRVESFGLIAGEALSHGCVCICASSPCLPELCGDASLYYEPMDGGALAQRIRDALSWDDGRRAAMATRARSRSQGFSWETAAAMTVKELAKSAGLSP